MDNGKWWETIKSQPKIHFKGCNTLVQIRISHSYKYWLPGKANWATIEREAIKGCPVIDTHWLELSLNVGWFWKWCVRPSESFWQASKIKMDFMEPVSTSTDSFTPPLNAQDRRGWLEHSDANPTEKREGCSSLQPLSEASFGILKKVETYDLFTKNY